MISSILIYGKTWTHYHLKSFQKIAYDCLKDQRSDRPDIDHIVIRLRQALDLQWKHENPGILNQHSQGAGEVEGTSTNRLEWKNLEHLKISSHDIGVATDNFSQTQCIGEGGYAYTNKNDKGLAPFVRQHFQKGTQKDMLDSKIMEEFDENIFTLSKGPNQDSLETFLDIAYRCLAETHKKRPKIGIVVEKLKNALQLQKNHKDNLQISLEDIKLSTNDFSNVLLRLEEALKLQDDYEIWRPKLPHDYEEIFKMSKESENYLSKKKKDLHDMLSEGILLQKGKVLFSLDDNGDRNEMISARKLLYKHRRSHKWPSGIVPKSRFHEVAEISNISNLRLQIKSKAQFLSPGVNYGVHLVFRFCGPRRSLAKRMYVNLKYKKGSETLHTHFATWREDGWMKIELCRFSNCKEDTKFEFLLESFSRCYCGSRDVYVEGIQFQAINNVKHEEIKVLKESQQSCKSDLNVYQEQQLPPTSEEVEKLSTLKEENKKKHYMLLAKEALYESSNMKLFNSINSTQFRSQEEVLELARQQVFRIKCKIESQRLSPDTEYACYLVFKLSEQCHGLRCPVIVRELSNRKKKNTRIIYFRSPSPCNVNDTDWVPVERENGWMEVNVWQFNSSNKLQDDCVSINLKLISYEGTLSGLIISSIEFRPI
ncbi:unnamed protein product [Lactuca virosa]|uniref:Protein kinase domain-containing protein n=1 Tax=Lactuca virosa TaxID=75947 RepID=A0AAU9NWF8_9ASTR|nr:unnamed protein product [Lactuca virosa]